MTDKSQTSNSPFHAIKAIDYMVIFVRDMEVMRRFYEDILGLSLTRQLSHNWLEYRIGNNTLVLARRGMTASDPEIPKGSAALQLAFRVTVPMVDACAAELVAKGIDLVAPPTDRDFGHRTLFFRDPDGNLLEIYAEI